MVRVQFRPCMCKEVRDKRESEILEHETSPFNVMTSLNGSLFSEVSAGGTLRPSQMEDEQIKKETCFYVVAWSFFFVLRFRYLVSSVQSTPLPSVTLGGLGSA